MFLILLFTLFLSSVNPIKAADEFKTTQKINYQFDTQGNVSVTQEVQLINNFSEIYPTTYQLSLSGPNLENIIGTDDSGNIIQKTDRQGDIDTIYIKFNKANLGKDKITKFNLSYTIPNLATKKGNTWEIPIPEIQNIQPTDSIETTISVPSSFGNLAFSSISPQNTIPLNNQTQLFFNQNNQKIFLIFGSYQLFDFKFKYFLNNSSSQSQIMEIAIPPENDIQRIVYKEILPEPINIRVDEDGNWLAQYNLTTNQELEINISGQAKITPNIIKTPININNYLKEQNYWPINDPSIKQIVSSLNNIKDIYNYTVNTLNYDYDSVNASVRKGALDTLLSPNNSICTDFTDLFITLARAKGIPAREVEGFAYTNNSKIKPVNTNTDVLHAWPQYYDQTQQAWVSVDPTWGKTTNGIDYFSDLDPDHFAFVFHGIDSQNPQPAGAYKNKHSIKTTTVEFASQELNPTYQNLKITPKKNSFFQTNSINIYNPNNNGISNMTLTISELNWQKTIYSLPPKSSIEIKIPNIPILKSINPKNRNIDIQLKSADINNSFSIINPKYYLNLVILIGLVVTFLGLGGIILNRNKSKQK